MDKIPTIFKRDDRFKVIPEIQIGCEWVFDGEGKVTEKLDGTNVRVTVFNGHVVKVEKAEGQEPGYIEANRNDPADKHIFKAVDNTSFISFPDGSYSSEAVGPKIQGNPLALEQPTIYPFVFRPTVLPDMVRTYEAIRDYVLHLDSQFNPGHAAEGIVYHHPDGRMAKIKKRDFR